MARGNNPAIRVGDVLLDTANRGTVKVTRLIGNERIEIADLQDLSAVRIVESAYYVRGITSGNVRRVFEQNQGGPRAYFANGGTFILQESTSSLQLEESTDRLIQETT